MQARRLNADGLRVFVNAIDSFRVGEIPTVPGYALTDESLSEAIGVSLDFRQEDFDTRYELGKHVAEVFEGKDASEIVGDTGFWSWLALFYFDQLCPPKAGGSRRPSMAYHYVLSSNYQHRYRHSIYTTWQLVSAFGDASRFLLCNQVPVRGELIEQLMARQYYLSCTGVMEAAAELYWDQERQKFKRGAAARSSAGCVSRFVSWLQQLELTYDVYSMTGDQLLGLMPAEFARFKK